MGSFSDTVAKFAQESPEKCDKVLRKFSFEVASRIILKTPVDEGTARANWHTSAGAPDLTTSEAKDPTGGEAIASARRATAQWIPSKTGLSLFIANSLPYIQALEDGHSKKQAPNGMVKTTVAEADMIIVEKTNER